MGYHNNIPTMNSVDSRTNMVLKCKRNSCNSLALNSIRVNEFFLLCLMLSSANLHPPSYLGYFLSLFSNGTAQNTLSDVELRKHIHFDIPYKCLLYVGCHAKI